MQDKHQNFCVHFILGISSYQAQQSSLAQLDKHRVCTLLQRTGGSDLDLVRFKKIECAAFLSHSYVQIMRLVLLASKLILAPFLPFHPLPSTLPLNTPIPNDARLPAI